MVRQHLKMFSFKLLSPLEAVTQALTFVGLLDTLKVHLTLQIKTEIEQVL